MVKTYPYAHPHILTHTIPTLIHMHTQLLNTKEIDIRTLITAHKYSHTNTPYVIIYLQHTNAPSVSVDTHNHTNSTRNIRIHTRNTYMHTHLEFYT